jgi:hypothetical protein
VFEDVRPDDPVVNVAPADELYVRPAIPNEIDLLDVVEVDPVRPIFFDQRLLVTMVEDVNTKALFFGATGARPGPISRPRPLRLMCFRIISSRVMINPVPFP